MPENRHPAYHPPQAPSQDSVDEHKGEGDGPFGSNMSDLLGGTRSPESQELPIAPESNSYSTGTSSTSGQSLTADDPRAHFDHNSKTTADTED